MLVGKNYSTRKLRMTSLWFLLNFGLAWLSLVNGCPQIVTRAQWRARRARSTQVMRVPVPHVIIHHTTGPICSNKESCSRVARQTQNFHMDTRKWADLGYSFLVGGDGRIYEGRGWRKVGAHAPNYNSRSIGISFMGNFDKKAAPSNMIQAAKSLISCGVGKGVISRNYQLHGHRDVRCTACPGQKLYNEIRRWKHFKGGRLPGYTC